MCIAHDGGVSAALSNQSRRPLSRSLTRPTAPPSGGARVLKTATNQLASQNAQPSCPSKSPAHDRRRDASVVSSSPDAKSWHGISTPISHRQIHHRFRVPPRAALRRSGRRAACNAIRHVVGYRANDVADLARLRSVALHEPRRAEAHGPSFRSDHPDSKKPNSRAQRVAVGAHPSVAYWRTRHLPLAGEDGQRPDS